MEKKNDVIIIGASGHGLVIADIILKMGDNIIGFVDDNDALIDKSVLEYPVLGKVDEIIKYREGKLFIIGIGDNYIRKQIAEKYNVNWYTAIHPSAVIAVDVIIEEGTVVMANSVINTSAKIGKHCIINSGAIIEHENILADYVHISPNASIGGIVSIGAHTHIGIGAAIKDEISICPECIIGAGAVVVKDITEKGTYIGVPARML